MEKKEIQIEGKGTFLDDAVMTLLGILAIIPILYVFRLVLLGIANGTLFLPV